MRIAVFVESIFILKAPRPCLGIVFYNGEMMIGPGENLLAIPFGVFL
jgi:hypothetical protein